MFQDQCVSVTDLRTKTKECLENLSKVPKFIFVNNRPVAVLLGIGAYDVQRGNLDMNELRKDEVTAALKKQARSAKKLKKADLIDIE